MKFFFALCVYMVLCAIGMHSFAQNVINQSVIVSGDSNNASSSNDDIGGVEFRRILSDRKKWYYFEFENYHSFPVTVNWQASISSDKFSHWYSYGDVKSGTIVIPANSKKRTAETLGMIWILSECADCNGGAACRLRSLVSRWDEQMGCR